MSQQSNRATLREALEWMKQQSKRTDIGPSRREAFELCWRKVELAASGTEAAPSEIRTKPLADVGVGCGCDEAPECTHSLYWWIGFKEGQKTLLLDQKDAAPQAAVDVREATCFAIAALEPKRLQSTEYKTGFIDAKNFALELVQRQPAQAAVSLPRQASPEGEGREAFERWVLATHEQTQPFGLVERSGDGYLDGTTQKEWKGWQAALRQSAAPSGGAALVSKLRDLPVHKIGASSSSWDDVEPTEYVRLSDLNALLA